MASDVGVAQSHLSAIERGKKEPGVAVLYRIAKRYGKSIEWLLTGVEGTAAVIRDLGWRPGVGCAKPKASLVSITGRVTQNRFWPEYLERFTWSSSSR